MVEQFRQADGNSECCQPPVDFLERDIDIGQAKNETDWLAVHLSNGGEIWPDQRFHFFRQMGELRFGERNKAPIIFPGVIVNATKPLAFGKEISQIAFPNGEIHP